MNRPRRKSYRHRPPALLKLGLRGAEKFAPAFCAKWSANLFCRPRRRPARPIELEHLSQSTRIVLPAPWESLAVHAWGEGPTVLLTHGWGGSAAQLSPLAIAIAEAGFQAVAFDMPAHGNSGGKRTHLPQMAEVSLAVAEQMGEVKALVGHSMGGSIFARAMQCGLEVDKAVFLCPPAEMLKYGKMFQAAMQLQDATLLKMIAHLGDTTGLSWDLVTAEALGVGQSTPMLLLHDHDDIDVPLDHAQRWHDSWPGSTLELTSGFGHRRILRERSIHERVIEFLR